MKKVVWNRRYDGPVDVITFKKLKIGMRIYFSIHEWDREGVPVTLEGTITGLKFHGYVHKTSIKVYDEKIGTMYIHKCQVLRILKGKKLINIEFIEAECFMQYSRLQHKVSPVPVQIVGANRAGKSSIYEMVYWCLFGETARGTKDVIKHGEKEARVFINGKIDDKVFEVVRRKSSNKHTLEIYLQGKDLSSGNLILDQETIEKLLCDRVTFLSSTLFGHNSFRFSRAKDSERKQVLDGIPMLDFSRWYQAKDYCSVKLKEINSEITGLTAELGVHEGNLEDLKDRLETIKKKDEKERLKKITEKETEIKYNKKELKNLSYDSSLIKKQNEVRGEKEELLQVLTMERRNLDNYTKTQGKPKCPACGQVVSRDVINMNIESTKARIDETMKSLKSVEKKIEAIDRQLSIKEKHDILVDAIKDLEQEIIEIRHEKSSPVEEITRQMGRIKRSITSVTNCLSVNRAEKEVYDFWLKGFGNTGIISLLVDEFLVMLNKSLMEISEKLTDGEILVQFSSQKETKKGTTSENISMKVFLDGDLYDYSNLSNSEKQRVDLMTMFAFKKVYDTGKEINIVFFDEVFEGLDEFSTDMMLRYIRKEFQTKSCYVMSHSKDVKFKLKNQLYVQRDSRGSFIEQ